MTKFKVLLINIYVLFNTLGLLSQSNSGYNNQCNLWSLDNSITSNFSSSGASVWLPIQTATTSQIADVFFIDSLYGWASHLAMGVIRTSNSGFNWIATSFNDTTFTTGFNGIHFINNNTGWAVGGALQIRKTTDGGLTWTRQIPPPVAGILRSIYFFDATTGYSAGSKSFPYIPFICKTTNGGINWIEISPSFSGAQELNDQNWFNASTGWICGYDVLLYTSNGGTNFSNLYSNVPPSGNGHIALLAINFANAQTGWLGAANLERNNVYKTTNGGVNWFFQNNPISQGGMNQINDIQFISTEFGWAVHGTPGTGAIMFTSNGGTNWTIEENSVNWFDCLHIYTNKKAWCGASGGRMWYTIPQDPVGIININSEIPQEFSLSQNYPNPFNPVTSFKFQVPSLSGVKIIVFDILGREVATLVNEQLKPGTYEVDWDGSKFASGVYYYKLTSGEFTETRKAVLIK